MTFGFPVAVAVVVVVFFEDDDVEEAALRLSTAAPKPYCSTAVPNPYALTFVDVPEISSSPFNHLASFDDWFYSPIIY